MEGSKGRRPTLEGQNRVIVSPANMGTVSEVTLGENCEGRCGSRTIITGFAQRLDLNRRRGSRTIITGFPQRLDLNRRRGSRIPITGFPQRLDLNRRRGSRILITGFRQRLAYISRDGVDHVRLLLPFPSA